jgi:hypothetical protein
MISVLAVQKDEVGNKRGQVEFAEGCMIPKMGHILILYF